MTAPGVLDGIRIVEFAQNAAIPHCGRLLAGLGADVVKIEPPSGDAMRHLAKIGDEGRAYLVINPGKRGVAIDLEGDGAREVVDALIAWADIGLVAMKLADVERYGLDWERVREINPRLIHLIHTALGPEGPNASDGGYDVLVQGRSGVGWVMNRSGGSAPEPTRPAINDFGTGIASAFAVMAALRHRDLTGEGQRVDTSLLGTAVSLGTPIIAGFPVDDDGLAELDEDISLLRMAGASFDDQRAHYESRIEAARGAFQLYFRHYRTADGLISVAGLSPGLMAKFHAATGITAPTAVSSHDESFQAIVAEAEECFASRTTAEWTEILRDAGYPCGPYNMPHEAVRDPQVLANDYVVEVDHPTIGRHHVTGMPLRLEKNHVGLRGPSPRLGEHTTDVLTEISIAEDRIAELQAAGTIAQLDLDA